MSYNTSSLIHHANMTHCGISTSWPPRGEQPPAIVAVRIQNVSFNRNAGALPLIFYLTSTRLLIIQSLRCWHFLMSEPFWCCSLRTMTSYLSSCKLSLVCVEVPLNGLVPFFVGVLIAWFLALQGLDGSMPCMTTTGLCPWSTLVYHSSLWAFHASGRELGARPTLCK